VALLYRPDVVLCRQMDSVEVSAIRHYYILLFISVVGIIWWSSFSVYK